MAKYRVQFGDKSDDGEYKFKGFSTYEELVKFVEEYRKEKSDSVLVVLDCEEYFDLNDSECKEVWFKDGVKHRDDDEPAVIHRTGTLRWYKNGKRHRDNDKPAIIWNNGTTVWYKDGKLHREDGPAKIYPHGTKEWWINGCLHRKDGPAVVKPDGTEKWYKNGTLYNEDGPAVEFESGYAAEYWIEGRVIKSYQEFQELTNHSDEYITYLKLKHGEIR